VILKEYHFSYKFKPRSSELSLHVVMWYGEDGGSVILGNVDNLPHHFTV